MHTISNEKGIDERDSQGLSKKIIIPQGVLAVDADLKVVHASINFEGECLVPVGL